MLAGYGVDEPLWRCAHFTARELIAAQDRKVADALNGLYNEMRASNARVDALHQLVQAPCAKTGELQPAAAGASRTSERPQDPGVQTNEGNGMSSSVVEGLVVSMVEEKAKKLLRAVVDQGGFEATRDVVLYRQNREGTIVLPPGCFEQPGNLRALRLDFAGKCGADVRERLVNLL